MIHRTFLSLVFLGLCVAGTAGPWSPAAAHASLTSSSPSDGARLDTLPERVVLTFSEEMSAPAYVILTAPDGTAVVQGEPTVADEVVRADLADVDQEGTYALAFRVVSADGHPVTGRVRFVVGDGPLDPTPPAASPAGADDASGADDGTSPEGSRASSSSTGQGIELWHVQVGVAVLLFTGAALLCARSRTHPT